MDPQLELADLKALNQIIEHLNRSVDVQTALDSALEDLILLMGLETGWLFIRDPAADALAAGTGYRLAAHRNLPPAMQPGSKEAWHRGCDCQALCDGDQLDQAYNEVRCSRLATVSGDRGGLRVHASAPLRSGTDVLGILNVACEKWESFTPRALELLSNAGAQIGAALERAQFYDSLRSKRAQEQSALLELSSQLLKRPDLDGMMESLVTECQQLTGAEAGGLLLATEVPHAWDYRYARGWRADPAAASLAVDANEESLLAAGLSTGEAFFIGDSSSLEGQSLATQFKGEGFVAAAFVPLAVDGTVMGGLLLAHRRPMILDEGERRFLRLASQQAAAAFEKARLHREELARRQLEDELGVAHEIQNSLLPERAPQLAGWDLAAVYLAAQQIGGDFFDFLWPPGPEETLGLVIADVMGKGVPAALFMALCRTMIRSTALSGRTPAQALIRAHELILKDSTTDRFLSAFYGVLGPETGLFTFSNAGHNPPLLLRHADRAVVELSAQGMILGAVEEFALAERTVRIEPGDALLLYTDGITEAMDESGEPFGSARLAACLEQARGKSAIAVQDQILAAVRAHQQGGQQSDDITMVVAVRGSGP